MEFEEKQSLNIWWLYLVTAATLIPTLGILFFYKNGPSYQELKNMYFLPIGGALFPFLIIFIIQKNVLTLNINQENISFKYFPFHIKPSIFSWMQIEKAYIRKYDAFAEYGGYGTKNRLWFKFKDKAYLLNDNNKGLQLEFKNGRKLLFSSNKVDELELFLINLKIRYNIQAIN